MAFRATQSNGCPFICDTGRGDLCTATGGACSGCDWRTGYPYCDWLNGHCERGDGCQCRDCCGWENCADCEIEKCREVWK